MTTSETIQTEFGFHMEFLDDKNQVLRDRRLTSADFGRAIRHTRFDAFRRGLVDHYQPSRDARIEPIFQTDQSSPAMRGFDVNVALPRGGEHSCQFDIGYFAPSANRVRAELKRSDQLTEEQELYYRLHAYLDETLTPDDGRPSQSTPAISFEPPTPRIPFLAGSRGDYGPADNWDEPRADDLPVLIDQALVLEDMVEEARANPDREIAGFLLGQLKRNDESGEIFTVVSGLASAGETAESTATSVTYTPSSFAQVKNIIQLRGGNECVVGWYHSHPFKLCAECPLPTPPECLAKILFYSSDDMHLMETTFEHPFMVGLLVAVEPRVEDAIGHLPVKLYGWCEGNIKERGFEVIRSALP